MITNTFLKKTSIFCDLDDDQLAAVKAICVEKAFSEGDKVFGEGDDASALCIVADGSVDLRFDLPDRETSADNTIATLAEGRTFMWSSLVPPHKARLSSYCASRTCHVVMLDRDKLMDFFSNDKRTGYLVMKNLAAVVGKRFHELQDEIAKRKGYELLFNW